MRRSMMAVAAGVLCLSVLPSCRSTARDPYRGFANQERDIREVRGRVGDLRDGMGPTEVELVLGAPARRSADQWVYLPEFRAGEPVPEAIYVQFDDGQFASWSLEPVAADDDSRRIGNE